MISTDPMSMLRSMLSAGAEPKPRPAAWVRAIRELYWIGFIAIVVARLGFGAPAEIAGIGIVAVSAPSLLLMLAQRGGLVSGAIAGEQPSWFAIGRRVLIDAAIIAGLIGYPLLSGLVTAVVLAPLAGAVHRRIWRFVKAREAERIAAYEAAKAEKPD